jgi:hypothetical protein
MPDRAVEELAGVLPRPDRIGVDARLADHVAAVFGLAEHSRVTLHRLGDFRPPTPT